MTDTQGRAGWLSNSLDKNEAESRPGLNAAVTFGHEIVATRGATRLLVIHADLPLLQPEDVEALLRESAPVTLAPDLAGSGTNALLIDANVDGFHFRFGTNSRIAHVNEAAAHGLRTAIVQRPGTGTDLDTVSDWVGLPEVVRLRLQHQPTLEYAGQPDQ